MPGEGNLYRSILEKFQNSFSPDFIGICKNLLVPGTNGTEQGVYLKCGKLLREFFAVYKINSVGDLL
ncbi:hypothetical protein DW928_08355 [Firmicutes bacterium AM43-11BH]|nr:hypothetical protein DW928_08355 [Firmicutes bacterium AM43-11BH]